MKRSVSTLFHCRGEWGRTSFLEVREVCLLVAVLSTVYIHLQMIRSLKISDSIIWYHKSKVMVKIYGKHFYMMSRRSALYVISSSPSVPHSQASVASVGHGDAPGQTCRGFVSFISCKAVWGEVYMSWAAFSDSQFYGILKPNAVHANFLPG